MEMHVEVQCANCISFRASFRKLVEVMMHYISFMGEKVPGASQTPPSLPLVPRTYNGGGEGGFLPLLPRAFCP